MVLGAADVNLLKVPDDLEDKKVVLLSDIMPTGWHGATLANVQKGDRVAVWGCGPGAPGLPSCPGWMRFSLRSLCSPYFRNSCQSPTLVSIPGCLCRMTMASGGQQDR